MFLRYVKKSLKDLSVSEWFLFVGSVLLPLIAYLAVPKKDVMTLIASVFGTVGLVFVAKGNLLGQFTNVIFAVFYGIISYFFKYYGEMITYLCMNTPMAIFAIVSWAKHPYEDKAQVTVAKLTKKTLSLTFALTAAVTAAFFFILRALGNANLPISTVSIFTSFLGASFVFLRTPYYGVAYAANDIVLVVLWSMASAVEISYLPMVLCSAMFLINDVYGFVNWRKMQRNQKRPASAPVPVKEGD